MGSINSVLSSGSTLQAPAEASSGSKNPQKIQEAATQFESLLIGQVLKSAHEDEGGWLGNGDDQTASSAIGMADEYLAQSISKRGGFGLAQMISRQLGSASE
jgi:peptidoglycan hydrolase FlgJ